MEKSGKTPNKPFYIVLSIVLAFCFWLYVRTADNQDKDVTIRNIPITFVGKDVLSASDLMLTSGEDSTISLNVQGKWNVISRLRRDNITIEVDLSHIATAGEYNLAYDINWPSDVSAGSVAVLERSPFYVSVTVSKRVTRPIELRGVFTGSLADGYQGRGFTFQPSTIEISGVETEVAKVAYAQVTLNRTDLSETVREDMNYILVGQDGEPVENAQVEVSQATVNVTYSVVMVKEVPLTVDLIPGGGADGEEGENVKVSFTPPSILLAGSEDDLAAYSSINLGSIDLAKVIGADSRTFAIPIGQEVENLSGVENCTVVVSIQGLSTMTLEAENIEIINAPEGLYATPITQTLRVQVRGSEEALSRVLPQYIRVVVDLKDQSLPVGLNVVTPKVTLSGISDAGVIGEYKVSISLGADPPAEPGH